jgi:ribosomal protein S18 acetylase RimI-like enzyme
MTTPIIRPLTPSDWQRYKSIRLRSLENSPDAFGSTFERELTLTDEEWQARVNPALRDGLALPLIVEFDGNAVGLACGVIHSADASVAHVYQMWISPEMRGKGIAKALLAQIKTWAVNMNCKRVTLGVTTNNHAAVSLYKSFGFVATGDVEELRAGSALRSQTMVFELTDSYQH